MMALMPARSWRYAVALAAQAGASLEASSACSTAAPVSACRLAMPLAFQLASGLHSCIPSHAPPRSGAAARHGAAAPAGSQAAVQMRLDAAIEASGAVSQLADIFAQHRASLSPRQLALIAQQVGACLAHHNEPSHLTLPGGGALLPGPGTMTAPLHARSRSSSDGGGSSSSSSLFAQHQRGASALAMADPAGALPLAGQRLLAAVAAQLLPALHSCSLQDVSRLLQAGAASAWQPPAALLSSLSAWLLRTPNGSALLRSAPYSSLADLAAAVAQLRSSAPPELLQALLLRAMLAVEQASAADLARLLPALAAPPGGRPLPPPTVALAAAHAQLLDAAARQAQRLLPACRPEELTAIAEALAASGRSSPAFMQAAASAVTPSLQAYSMDQQARLCAAFAAGGHFHALLMEGIAAAGAQQAGLLSAPQLCSLVRSYAQLGVNHAPLFGAIAQALPLHAQQLSGPQAATLVADLAAVGHYDEQLNDTLSWVLDDARLASCSLEQLAGLAGGLAALRHRHHAVLQRLAQRVAHLLAAAPPGMAAGAGAEEAGHQGLASGPGTAPADSSTATPQHLLCLAAALAELDQCSPEAFAAIAEAALPQVQQGSWAPPQLCQLLGSFATAGHYSEPLLAAALQHIGAQQRPLLAPPLSNAEQIHVAAAFIQAAELGQAQAFKAWLANKKLLSSCLQAWYGQLHNASRRHKLALDQLAGLLASLGARHYRNCRSTDGWFVVDLAAEVGGAMVALEVVAPEEASANRPVWPLGQLQYRARSLLRRDWLPCFVCPNELSAAMQQGPAGSAAWMQALLRRAVAQQQPDGVLQQQRRQYQPAPV